MSINKIIAMSSIYQEHKKQSVYEEGWHELDLHKSSITL